MKSGFGYIGALSLAFATVACGGTDATDPETNTNGGKEDVEDERTQITRDDIGESSFKPTALENTVDDLVSAIEDAPPADSVKLKIVLKQLTGYWEPVQLGAKRALSELGATGGVDAPLVDGGEEAIARQNEILQDDREAGYNGFAVAPFEKPVGEQIDAAVDEGIPVLTLDSDLPESKRDLYIGTMNADAGETGGKSLVDLLDGDGGTVVVYGHDDAGWPDGYDRTMGAVTVLEDAGYDVVVRRVDWTDEGEALDMEFLTTTLETADPPVVGMLGVFSVAFRCAQAAEAVGKEAGDVKIAAFDFDANTVEYMASGYIQVTHAQRQYYMGYLSPYVLYGINVLGAEKTKEILAPHMVDNVRFNAGLDVVPAAQLDDYYSYLDALGIGGL
jgi:ribose transport system substrate-binding protein